MGSMNPVGHDLSLETSVLILVSDICTHTHTHVLRPTGCIDTVLYSKVRHTMFMPCRAVPCRAVHHAPSALRHIDMEDVRWEEEALVLQQVDQPSTFNIRDEKGG